jgi:hypothetical protein
MSLTQGEPLPSIETTKEIETTAPDWYTDYLKDLATAGQKFIGAEADKLVAPLGDIQKNLFENVETGITSYTDPFEDAETALTGLTDIDLYGDYIQNLMDKYEDDVVQEMARQQQMDMQRYLLPTLKGAFVGSGGLGGQRYAGALGQMGGDVAANLAGQQAQLRQKGFSEAMQAALRQAEIERGAASDLTQLGAAESQATERSARALADIGAIQRGYQQERLLAPLSAAKSAADIYANLKVPSTVMETAKGPIPGAYSTSPLSQIAGLGTLFAAGTGGKSAIEGFSDFLGAIPGAIRGFGSIFTNETPRNEGSWYD